MSPLTFHLEPLDVAGADEDGLERPQGEVVVRLRRQLLLAQLEERHQLLAQLPRRAEPLREQHHLRDQRPVRLGHGLHWYGAREGEREGHDFSSQQDNILCHGWLVQYGFKTDNSYQISPRNARIHSAIIVWHKKISRSQN